jgi:hypothetical protein
VRFPLYGGPNRVVIRLKNDFGLTLSDQLPPLGSASRGLRVISESWNVTRNQFTLEVSGRAGHSYKLSVWNPDQVSSVEGAVLSKQGELEIQMPQAAAEAYVPQKVTIHFGR